MDSSTESDIDSGLIESLNFLLDLKEPSLIALNEKCHVHLLYILNSVKHSFTDSDYELLIERNFYQLLMEIIHHLSAICHEFDIENYLKKPLDLNSNKIQIFYTVLQLIYSLVHKSIKLCLKFNETTLLIQALFNVLKNNVFIDKCLKSNMLKVFEFIVSSLFQLSRFLDDEKAKIKWHECDVIRQLLKISNLIKPSASHAYYTIINIAYDKHFENVDEIKLALIKLVDILNLIAEGFSFNLNLSFKEVEILDNDKSILKKNVYFIETHLSSHSVISILELLYKMSINEKLKKEMFYSLRVKDSLKIILDRGIEIEKKCVLKILAQFSFNKSISRNLLKDKDLIIYVSSLLDEKSNEKNDLIETKELCKIIKLNLSDIVKSENNKEDTKAYDLEFIVISYHYSYTEISEKLKKSLENFGFKVWLNETKSSSSRFESNLKAIENCLCFLVIFSEKYRSSVECQAQAQYAYRLSKPIMGINVKIEEFDCWLKLIIEKKNLLALSKNELEREDIERLKVHLTKYLKPNIQRYVSSKNAVHEVEALPNSENNLEVKTTEQKELDKTTTDEGFAIKWFKENNLNMNILEELKPCNSSMLKQIYDMKCKAPEFYYQTLKEIKQVDIRSIVIFSECLENLFKNSMKENLKKDSSNTKLNTIDQQ
jgi:hypothetical protein